MTGESIVTESLEGLTDYLRARGVLITSSLGAPDPWAIVADAVKDRVGEAISKRDGELAEALNIERDDDAECYWVPAEPGPRDFDTLPEACKFLLGLQCGDCKDEAKRYVDLTAYHRAVMAEARSKWPSLWAALDELIKEAPE